VGRPRAPLADRAGVAARAAAVDVGLVLVLRAVGAGPGAGRAHRRLGRVVAGAAAAGAVEAGPPALAAVGPDRAALDDGPGAAGLAEGLAAVGASTAGVCAARVFAR